MAIGWRVMVHLYYGVSRGHVSGYNKLVIFPPCSTYLFEFVGIYPWFQCFFVLIQFLRSKGLYEQLVREYCDVLVVGGSLIVVWSSGEGICTAIVFPRYVLQLDVIFFKFKYLSCNTSANLLWLSPVCEIGVVGVDYDFVG